MFSLPKAERPGDEKKEVRERMNRSFLLKTIAAIIVSGLLALPVLAGGLPKPTSKKPEAQKLIDQAWALEKKDSNAEIYKQCIALMEKANQIDPNNPGILTDLARYWWNYGDNLPKQTAEQKKRLEGIYEKGMAYAEKSLKIKETSGGHYWYAVNKAASLEFSSMISQAAAFPSIYKHSQWVTDHEPNYYYGAPGRLWSEVLTRVPKKVVEMVHWNVQEAVDEINKAIKIEPRYFDNYVYKARFLYKYFGNKQEALKLLDYVLKQSPNVFPEEITANKVSQRDARILWKQITGKEYPAK